MIATWYLGLPEIVQAICRAVLWVLFVFIPVPIFIWWERRLLAWMQDRVGPNRVGNITFKRRGKSPGFLKGRKFRLFGLLQPIADGIKSFTKEDMAPAASDKFVYFLAPALAVFPAFAIGAVVPWFAWRPLAPVANPNIGVLYLLAVASLGVYGVVLGGYASNNKYSMMGGLRASAQLISYELSMGMALAAIVLATGSLRITDMVTAQEQSLWGVVPFLQNWYVFTPFGAVAFVIFGICMVAETNRAPFDLPEAENELVSGYNTEYTTKKWVMYMMGEYISMFIWSGVLVSVFLGGYNLFFNWDWMAKNLPGGPLWDFISRFQYWFSFAFFFGKSFAVFSCYIWARATLPRLRYDHLMAVGWKWLLPLATANFMVVALWEISTRLISEHQTPLVGVLLGWVAVVVAMGIFVALYRLLKSFRPGEPERLVSRKITLVDPTLDETKVPA